MNNLVWFQEAKHRVDADQRKCSRRRRTVTNAPTPRASYQAAQAEDFRQRVTYLQYQLERLGRRRPVALHVIEEFVDQILTEDEYEGRAR